MIDGDFRTSVKSYYDYQAMRVRMGNRLKMKKDGEEQVIPEGQEHVISEKVTEVFHELYQNAELMEAAIEKYIKKELKSYPVYTQFLKDVKGVGPMMAAVIISEYDITIATTVSKMWAFTGVAPGRDRLKKGEKAPFNTWLRAKMCGVLGSSFLKCKSPYSEYYYNMKSRLEGEERWKEKTPMHRHKAATRYMIKMFLRDLYVAWRTMEGLSVRPPYEEEYLGKKHIA